MQMLEFVSDQISISINRKKAEQDLRKALNKATESDRLKSTFLATMSHELRTPLNAIIGFSDIIDESLALKDIVEYAGIINTSGNQLLSIVEDLFDITLIEAGEIKIRKKEESLDSILEYVYNIVEIDRHTASKDKLELKLSLPPGDRNLLINTDPVKLKQILINLLRNALKFTEEGYVEFGYELIRDQDKAEIKFYVKDTGKGIPENKLSLIFDIFTQIEDTTTRAFGGTGIGLSIAKKLSEIFEATKEIKKFHPELPIIAQTAYAVEGDMEKSINAGCDDYISKPINKEVLIAKIEQYLGK